MKQVLFVRGQAVVEEVPAPLCEPGTVLVSVRASCISAGTELSGIRASGQPLWKRAISRPGQLKRGIEMVATKGLRQTRRYVAGELEAGQPTGYSAAGVVIEVGAGVTDLFPGDRVACAGAGLANHAEVIRVPRNLVTPIGDSCAFADASTVTLGAIALQGVRRASPTLGEAFVVLGLGAIGQLCVQVLRANGCRVIGTDVDEARRRLAEARGADVTVAPGDLDIDRVWQLTDGIGADGVIVCAASPSDEIVSTAFAYCRKKGRVVLVGDVGLALDRADIYEKELDFLVSTSYGPGRYDRSYEEEGADYPVAYVRWTENRNMASYLALLERGAVSLEGLVTARVDVEQAADAYQLLAEGGHLLVLLDYPGAVDASPTVVRSPSISRVRDGVIRVGVIGAGSFAKAELLPILEDLRDRYAIRAIASATGHNAKAVAKRFGADYATTDPDAVLADDEIEAVVIATRHDLHADLVVRALAAGKHVFVEKPLALNATELDSIEQALGIHEGKLVLTGFNRRFSSHGRRLAELLASRVDPAMLTYRMNAGRLPSDHWAHGPQGGGRNIGEACHIYDLFGALIEAPVVDVVARAIRPKSGHFRASDNFSATCTFADGSVATLLYTALGSATIPKERMEVFVDGRVAILDDYARLELSDGTAFEARDKGHGAELQAFADAIRTGEWPIPLWQQLQAMSIAFRVEEQLSPGDI